MQLGGVRHQGWWFGGGGCRRDTFKYEKNKTLLLVLKTYKEVKSHSSEESEDKVAEEERDNDENYKYVYCFLVERAPARSRLWNGGWG